jgi:hypothetical protein
MNITFQNQGNTSGASVVYRGENTETNRASRSRDKMTNSTTEAVNITFSAADGISGVFGNLDNSGDNKEKGKTLTDLQQEAAWTDVGISQDYMTLMSNTMSEEDYQKMSKEGFDFSSMNPEEAVTIVDKIKAELVRSGQQIIGYTDDLDVDTLAAAVGSDSLARALADSFQEADIPLTQDNVAAVEKAWNMASELSEPTEGTYRYMIDNELEPQIWNLYLAQNSGADNAGQSPRADLEDMTYLTDEKLQLQIDRILEQAGYEPNAENRESAQWLLERRLPLTEENLNRLDSLKGAVVPVTEEVFAQAVAEAVSEGKSPMQADLSGTGETGKNLYAKAVEVLEYYSAQYAEQDSLPEDEDAVQWLREQGNLTARKQLEEVRLRMTAEVNVKLLKSGFSIDTMPMEELIAALREAEKAVADNYFPGDESAVSKYENWNETNQVMQELPALPAQILGTVHVGLEGEENPTVLERFHAEGSALQQTYEKAGESYETLMTAPRADLGDSIRKAFGNVADLVRGLGMEPDEENCRAVRILGYNHMEIDVENVNRVKAADEQVQSLITKMTPAATLRMIRDGINPLEQSFAQLNDYFDNLPEDYQEQSESYSRYLYGLEQNQQITDEERESYIGVYRLLHQIEGRDGAAVGAVVSTQAELQFSNLLSAVRSGKFGHMDVRATDELGMLKELVKKGESRSISEQIASEYDRQRLEELRSVTQIDAGAPAMLERGEIPANAGNLLAAQALETDAANPFKALRKKSEELQRENMTTASELWEELSDKDAFAEDYEDMIADLQAQTEELTLDYAQTSLDVRELQMTHRQLSIMGSLAGSEEYFLPMYIGEELGAVHLTLERGQSSTKGNIAISVDWGDDAHVEAHLQVRDGRVEGFLLGKTADEVTKLSEASDIFYNLINESASVSLEATKLPVVSRGNINMTGTSENGSQGEETSPDNGTLYHVAKLFLQAIK